MLILFAGILLIALILITSVADINHGHGLEEVETAQVLENE